MASSAPAAALTLVAAAAGGSLAHWVWGVPAATVSVSALSATVAVLLTAPRFPDNARDTEPDRVEPVPAGLDETDEGLAMLDALPIGLMLVDPDRTIRFANHAFGQMVSRSNAAGNDVSILRANRLTERIQIALGQNAGSTLEFNLTRAGDAALKAHIRPLQTGGALVTVEDETQRKLAEEVHRDFVANASHELKTPLAASSGIIDTLLGHARTDAEASERFLELLQTQIGRMARLIDDLMSLNRIEMNARLMPNEPLHLADIIGETTEILTSVAEKAGIRLEFEREGIDVEVVGDRDQLCQLFMNLVDNAIKYSGAGTTVRIHAETKNPEPGMVGIVVEDQGIGIAREHLPRLTERFYRVNVRRSREVGGTGLGLAIVKHILNRHRGRLAVDSEPGRGTTFTVWLPIRGDTDEGRVEPAVTKPS